MEFLARWRKYANWKAIGTLPYSVSMSTRIGVVAIRAAIEVNADTLRKTVSVYTPPGL